ncbi:MAG: hypothetical protein EBX06_06245 [Rhodobacteraceae bacterium]|nr:hypothetical protein [Paracoccaceae bacterium]
MLKLIDNRLTAEVLYTLQKMGHGDVLIIADANFPSTSISKSTVSQSVLNMENLNAPEAIESLGVSCYAKVSFFLHNRRSQ